MTKLHISADAFNAIDAEVTAAIQLLTAIPALQHEDKALLSPGNIAAGLALEAIETLSRLQGLFHRSPANLAGVSQP